MLTLFRHPNVHAEWKAILTSALLGLIVCALPHAVGLAKLGEPMWVADEDELYYLGVASQAYHQHPWTIADPTRENGHGLYQSLPLLPGIVIARALRLGPQFIPLIWRCWGGLFAGVAWYFLLRLYCRHKLVALGVTILLVCDTGMFDFRPFWEIVWFAVRVFTGRTEGLFASKPEFFKAFRIATPCLTMPYLLLFLALYRRARDSPTLARNLGAAAGFGLLFHVYFYYWTAAALALVITWILDTGHRRLPLFTAMVGTVIGLPSLVSSYLMKSATTTDWLHRSDKFIAIGHLSELNFPRPAVGLVLIWGFVVWRYRRELLLPWSMATASLLLLNHQLITGLQIENFHWGYVCCPSLAFLVAVLIADTFSRPELARVLPLFVGYTILCIAVALWLRGVESVRTRESTAIVELYRAYRDQRLRDPSAARLEPRATVASDEVTNGWAAILEQLYPLSNYWLMLSPSVDDAEWDMRIALNGALLGQSRLEFAAAQRSILTRPGFVGLWGRDPKEFNERMRVRTESYDKYVASPIDAIERFGVKYLMLPAQASPALLPARWRLIQNGPRWSIWKWD